MIQIQTKLPLSEIAEAYLQMAKNPKQGNIVEKSTQMYMRAPKPQVKFWAFLIENLDKILVGTPFQLQEIIADIDRHFPGTKGRAGKRYSKFGKNLACIFNYKGFSENKNNGWNAYWLAGQLGIDTCPYCNRLFTHTVTDGSKNISRPQFDHFMDKVSYPYLAISFYNLVPSCAVCNSSLKGRAKFQPSTHSHPYLEGFGDMIKFYLKVRDVSFFHGNVQSGEIEFEKKQPLSKNEEEIIFRAEQNIEAFKLKEMYSRHIDYAQEQVNRALIYHPDYLDSLFQQFEGSLFRSREDLFRFISGNYVGVEQLSARPLSKLTRDIVEQFGLYDFKFDR